MTTTEATYRPTRLIPSAAIVAIDRPLNKVQRLSADMKQEIDGIVLEWEGIQAVGGGRDDHAAALLSRLIPHFNELAQFSLIVGEQLQQMQSDPFGRG